MSMDGRPLIRLFLMATRKEPLRQPDYTSDMIVLQLIITRVNGQSNNGQFQMPLP